MAGILGKKVGMTHIYDDNGKQVCVTVIEAGPCPIISVKDKAIQVGFDLAKESKTKKPIAGLYKKANTAARKFMREIPKEAAKEYKVGDEIKADVFKPGDFVDITGTSIGKGFQGGMKRWHWQGGPMTHGSTSHRRVGSMGSTTTPGRVWKGHHLPGHMGNIQVTVQNVLVVKTDTENNLLLVYGAVPGHKNNYLIIKTAKKKKPSAVKPESVGKAKKQDKKK